MLAGELFDERNAPNTRLFCGPDPVQFVLEDNAGFVTLQAICDPQGEDLHGRASCLPCFLKAREKKAVAVSSALTRELKTV
jgi:hypothetical protein